MWILTGLSEVLEVQQLLGYDLLRPLLLLGQEVSLTHGPPGDSLGSAGPPPAVLGGLADHAAWGTIVITLCI